MRDASPLPPTPAHAEHDQKNGMRDAYPLPRTEDGLARTWLACQCCGRLIILSVEGLFRSPSSGSIRRFCTPACRQAAYRRRRAAAPEDAPAQHRGGRRRKLLLHNAN